MFGNHEREGLGAIDGSIGDEGAEEALESLRLGRDIRFVLVGVGGAAIRIARNIAQRNLPYLETLAINCDARVQDLEDFDRRICLSPEGGAESDTYGSAAVGHRLARAAEPALDRVFEGATFVTILASLGGGTGTGALPTVLEAAARASQALKVFVVKPFECEGERRAIADRAIARLHFLEGFVEKQSQGKASLQVLDNESLVRTDPRMPMNRIERHWGDLVSGLIDRELIRPAEMVLDAERLAALSRSSASLRPRIGEPTLGEPDPLGPLAPRMAPIQAAPGPEGVELTFEILPPPAGSEPR